MPAVDDLTSRVEERLTRLVNGPAPVRRWQIDIGEDATGEKAVWVWAIVEDADLSRDVINGLREMVGREVRHLVPDATWVYVRFRAMSEV